VRDTNLLDCYRLLELQPGATAAEVREAYRVLSRVWHPDRFAGNPELLARATARQQELNDAYQRINQALQSGEAPDPDTRAAETPASQPSREQTEDQAADVAPSMGPDHARPWLHTRLRWLAASPGRIAAAAAVLALLALALTLILAGIIGGRDVLRTEDGAAVRGTALAAGGGHGCLAAGEHVACWGANDFGQAADAAEHAAGWPGPVWRQALPDSIASLAAGLVHSCAALRDGRVYCWGANFTGQLGDDRLQDRAQQAPIAFSATATAVASMGRHTCALTAGGSLFCWGDDTQGQLGLGRPTAECRLNQMRFLCAPRPERVGADGQWQAMAVGGGHTCAIDQDGQLHCWGSNRYGQLGAAAPETCRGIDGSSPCRRRPAPVAGLNDVAPDIRLVAAGASHTCVLEADGRAFCWGLNSLRQAGSDAGDVVERPTPMATSLRFTRLVAGAYHTCGITSAGGLHCWGSDVAGELRGRARERCGGGPCTARPVRLAASGTADAAAGFGITCVRRRDGLARCWGSGENRPARDGLAVVRRPASPGVIRRVAAGVRWRVAVVTGALRRNVVEPLVRVL
jgi:alpha-tubulin suppressor-like RCC1 family protein